MQAIAAGQVVPINPTEGPSQHVFVFNNLFFFGLLNNYLFFWFFLFWFCIKIDFRFLFISFTNINF